MPSSLGRRRLRLQHRFSLGLPGQRAVWLQRLQPLRARRPRLLLVALTVLCSRSPFLPPRLLQRWQRLLQPWADSGQPRCLPAVQQPVLWRSRRQSVQLLAAMPQARPCSSHSGCPALCQRRPRRETATVGKRVTATKTTQSLQLMMLSLAQKTQMRN